MFASVYAFRAARVLPAFAQWRACVRACRVRAYVCAQWYVSAYMLCTCICVYSAMCACMLVYRYVCAQWCVCRVHAYVCTVACVCACRVHAYVYAQWYVSAYMPCTCKCVYSAMCVCMLVYMYVCAQWRVCVYMCRVHAHVCAQWRACACDAA